jgi:diacylglycerol kinase (ATP)
MSNQTNTTWAGKRVRLIVNPTSGSQSAVPQLPTIVEAFEQAGIEALLSFTNAERSVTDWAIQAAREPVDLVIVAGGDGTVSAVGQGLLGTDIPLGILPIGTYNNIARSLGIPQDLAGALDVVLRGQPWRIDSATVNGKPFMEVAGVGLDARLFPAAEQIKSGNWPQIVSALRTLRYYRPRKLRIDLHDGRRLTTRPMMVIVSNMPFFGVGFAVAPTARPDSGVLVLSVFENMTKLELLRHFVMISNGRAIREPRISTYYGARFRIAGTIRAPLPVQADGNLITHTPAVFEIVPRALTVMVARV